MKPLPWLTWPLVVLLLGTMAILVGIPVWLIARGSAPASLIAGPISLILGAVASGIAAYAKGKNELPSWLSDPDVQKAIRSLPPPAGTPKDLHEDDLIPVEQGKSEPPRA